MSDQQKPAIPFHAKLKAAIMGGDTSRRPNADNAHMDAQPRWFQEMHGYTPKPKEWADRVEAGDEKTGKSR